MMRSRVGASKRAKEAGEKIKPRLVPGAASSDAAAREA
jgi:hypothetical protein